MSPRLLHAVAALLGLLMMGIGIARLAAGLSPLNLTWAILGFIVVGWVVLERRKYRRGTPESELDGDRTIE